MQTEMEKLKENTLKEKSKQTMESVFAYLDELDVLWTAALKEGRSNLNLMMVVIIVQIVLSFFSPLALLCFVVYLLLMFRQGKINERIEQHKGKTLGVWKTLYLLGIVQSDVEDEINKRKKKVKTVNASPFKRFKEFFERINSKQKQESYV